MSLSQCNFVNWDNNDKGAPAVDILAGSVIIQACRFAQDKADIHLGAGVRSAVIMGNQFSDTARIENKSKGEVQILGNVTTK